MMKSWSRFVWRTPRSIQHCALRYPGRLLGFGDLFPEDVVKFIGDQLGMTGEALLSYAARRQTRQEHLVALGPNLTLVPIPP